MNSTKSISRKSFLRIFFAIVVSVIIAFCLEFIAWKYKHLPGVQAFMFTGIFALSAQCILYGITNRFSFSWSVLVLIFTLLGRANYEKYKYLGMPIIGSDFDVLYEGTRIWLKILTTHDLMLLIGAGFSILLFLFVAFRYLPRLSISKPMRLLIAISGCLYIITIITFNVYTTKSSGSNFAYSKYRDFGFFTAYSSNLVNFLFMSDKVAITHDEAKEIYKLHNIHDGSISADVIAPDIIVVVSESFFNPEKLKNVTFKPAELVPNFNKLRKINPLNLYSPVFGGGTPAAEFEILTGYPHMFLDNLVNPNASFAYHHSIPSLPAYLKKLGYNTISINPNVGGFFSRNITTYNLGFDTFIPCEGMRYKKRRNQYWIGDDQMFYEAMDILQEKSDSPLFLFLLSMQNHSPYTHSNYSGHPEVSPVNITNDIIPQHAKDSVASFATGIHFSDQAMGELIEFISKRETPTLLVFTPDHLPPLPENDFIFNDLYQPNSAFVNYGVKELQKYSVEGFVFANFDLQMPVPNKPMSQFYLPLFILKWANLPKNRYFEFIELMYSKNRVVHSRYSNEKDTNDISEHLKTFKELTHYNLLRCRKKAKSKIQIKTSMEEFFSKRFNQGIFIVSASGDAKRRLPSLVANLIENAGGSIKSLKQYGLYAAIFKDGLLIKEKLNNQKAVALNIELDDFKIEAISRGKADKSGSLRSNIKVNGQDYHIIDRGLAVVSINSENLLYTTFNSFKHSNPKKVISSVELELVK